MSRLTDRRVVLVALSDAIKWNEDLLDSLGPDDEYSNRVKALIEAMRRVNKKISGRKLTISELTEEKLDEMTIMVSVDEVTRMNADK